MTDQQRQFSLGEWSRSKSVEYKNFPDLFAHALSERMHTRLHAPARHPDA